MKDGKHFGQEERLAVVKSAKEVGIKEAAQIAGVHYTTVYEWRREVDALGEEGFLACKVKSRGRGIKKVTEEQDKAVLETWKRYPGFGPGQVRNQLRRQGVTISTRTVRSIMEANGYKGKRKEAEKKECRRFEATRPLELAQMDILEFFINKLKVYLILLQDDFSRFILGWRLVSETSVDAVIGMVQEAIERFGKMEEVLSDRGFVFYSWRGGNRFERFLEVEGIAQTHARPHHPQTLGKVESTNKHIQKELLRRRRFESVTEAEEAIGKWVKGFNYERTHQGLGGFLVPADRFHGREAEVAQSISKHLDPEKLNCYDPGGISRSLVNVVLDPSGGITLYLFGHPVKIFGGSHA